MLTASRSGPWDRRSALRYGIVGTGMMGIEHISNLGAVDHAVITAVIDPNPDSLANGLSAAQRAFPHAEIATFVDHGALIGTDVCDVVVIATPNHTHHAILSDLLVTDMAVLVEKPMCTNTADCLDVVALSRRRRALTWVGLEYRYMPPVSLLIDEVRGGTVGRVQMVSIREHRFPFLTKVDDWNRLSANTGGTLVEKCCHYFDLMNLIVGERPKAVFASGGQNVNHLDEVYDGKQSDILDNAYVIVEYPRDVRAMLDLCMFAEASYNQEELSVVGDAGKVEALIPQNQVRIGRRGTHFIGDVEHHDVTNDDIAVEGLHHGSSYLEHVDLLHAVREGLEPAVTTIDGLWSVAIGEAAQKSIELGRPVQLAELVPTEAPR